MSRPHRPFPSAEEGLRFHRGLQTSDAVTPSDVCAAYVEPLLGWLTDGFPRVDPHLLLAAANEALFAYVQHPERYDTGRGDLAAYLRMAARGDLLNALRREQRHHRGRVAWLAVELDEERGNLSGREEEPPLPLQHDEEAAERERLLRAVAEDLTPPERRVLELMLAGERRTPAYAEALGITGLPPKDQEREVKRVKDRIKKRLERGGGTHG
jgi:RNA polymerase sigma factor (sigma-70 family)